MPPPCPWSEKATWPCGVKVTVSGAAAVAAARKNGSPSGS